MTRLKTNKRRTELEFALSTIESEESFDLFRDTINRDPENWIPLDNYLWGVADRITGQKSTPFVDLFLHPATTCPGSIRETELLVDFAREPYLEKSLDCLATFNAMAIFQNEFSADQYVKSLGYLVDQVLADHQELLLEDPITHQILFGEIPLTVGLRFPQLKESDALMEAGRIHLASAIREILDGDGLPNATYLEQSILLLACWTRCCRLCDLADMECLDVDAQMQLELFVRQMIRLMRKDGSLVFSDDNIRMKELVKAALGCYHDDDDANIAAVVFPKTKNGKKFEPSFKSLPESSVNSEWGQLAVLQTEWLPKLPKLTVNYQHRK